MEPLGPAADDPPDDSNRDETPGCDAHCVPERIPPLSR